MYELHLRAEQMSPDTLCCPAQDLSRAVSLSDGTGTVWIPCRTGSESGTIEFYRRPVGCHRAETVRQIVYASHHGEAALNPGVIVALSVSPLFIVSGIGVLAVISLVVGLGVVRVSNGKLAVATVAGGASRVLTSGTHLVPPLISRIHRYDARVQRLDCAGIETRNTDGTPVITDVVVEFAIEDVETVFRSVEDHEAVVVRQTEGHVLDILAAADDGRVTMSQRRLALDVRDALAESLEDIGLRVESVDLSAQLMKTGSDDTTTNNRSN